MSTLLRDIRYTLRQLHKYPVFFSVVVITLGFGIGANTTIFSLVDWLVLRSLPVRNPEQMHFLVFPRPAGNNEVQFSYPEFTDIENQTRNIFSGMTPYIFGGAEGAQNTQDGLTLNGVTKPIQTAFVRSDFFPVLGVPPAAGRFFFTSDETTTTANPVVVLSYNYWQNRFGGDPAVVGASASINGHAVTIIGVTPRGFVGPTPLVETQAYLPLGMYSIERGVAGDFLANPTARSMVAFVRVKPGTKQPEIRSELAVVGQRLLKDYPREGTIGDLRANPLRPPGLISGGANPLPKLAAVFLILAALVLALACVNVANLFLVRAFGRQREMAVRAALGAANGRLARQLLTESLVVTTLGCAFGITLGLVACRLLSTVPMQSELPFVLDFDFNWHAFLYAVLVSAGAAVLVTMVPVFRVWRGNVREVLHEGGRALTSRRQHLRAVLVAVEVAACLTLLVISGLFVRSLRGVQNADLGFNPQSVLNFTLDANQIGYTEGQGRVFYSAILERARALPGVQSASLASSVPLSDNISGDDLIIPAVTTKPGQPPPHATYCDVSADYFRTMEISRLRGRDFTAADTEGSSAVALINQEMAERYWPGQDPIGRFFATASDPKHSLTIIGVVRNVRMDQLYGPYEMIFYRPLTQSYEGVETLQIRSSRSPQDLVPEVRTAVQSLVPSLPIYGVRTMTEGLHGSNGLLFFELGAGLAGSLGLLGLVLALVGVYGLVSHAVGQRTQEIGIRMALGAQRRDILHTVGQQGLIVVAIGLAAGLLAAFTVGRLVGDFLVGIAPTDPVTFGGVSALLATVTMLATYVPVRRALRVNPIEALRHE